MTMKSCTLERLTTAQHAGFRSTEVGFATVVPEPTAHLSVKKIDAGRDIRVFGKVDTTGY